MPPDLWFSKNCFQSQNWKESIEEDGFKCTLLKKLILSFRQSEELTSSKHQPEKRFQIESFDHESSLSCREKLISLNCES